MEQMTLFGNERPYKYIMDTSSILSQKPGETHTRLVYESQWERIEEYMRSHSIVTCSEIFEEIKDKENGFLLNNVQFLKLTMTSKTMLEKSSPKTRR